VNTNDQSHRPRSSKNPSIVLNVPRPRQTSFWIESLKVDDQEDHRTQGKILSLPPAFVCLGWGGMMPSRFLLLLSLLLLSAASVQNSRHTDLLRNPRATFPVLPKLRGGDCSSGEGQGDQDGEMIGGNSNEKEKNMGVSGRSGRDSSDSLGFDMPSESAGSALEQSDEDGSDDDGESAGGLLSPHSYSSASDLSDLGDDPDFVRDVLDGDDLDPDLARFGWDGRLYAYPGQIVVPDDTWPSLKAIDGFNTSSHYKARDSHTPCPISHTPYPIPHTPYPVPRTPYPIPQTPKATVTDTENPRPWTPNLLPTYSS
jgi:hypothetical protein